MIPIPIPIPIPLTNQTNYYFYYFIFDFVSFLFFTPILISIPLVNQECPYCCFKACSHMYNILFMFPSLLSYRTYKLTIINCFFAPWHEVYFSNKGMWFLMHENNMLVPNYSPKYLNLVIITSVHILYIPKHIHTSIWCGTIGVLQTLPFRSDVLVSPNTHGSPIALGGVRLVSLVLSSKTQVQPRFVTHFRLFIGSDTKYNNPIH